MVLALLAAFLTVAAVLATVMVLHRRDPKAPVGAAPSALPQPLPSVGPSPSPSEPPAPSQPSSQASSQPSSSSSSARSGATSRQPTPRRSATPAARTTDAAAPNPGGANLALGRPATASSVEGEAYAPGRAFDGDPGSRWSSAFSDPQWISVDLGRLWLVTAVVLRWEAAYGVEFEVATSTDGTTWHTVWRTADGRGGVQEVPVAAAPARYVRMTGTRRSGMYGYSLFELEVR